MRVGGVDLDQQVLVIAEIGNNHEGNVEVARELVRRAAAAGADAVKFQTFRTEQFVAASDAERFARLKRFELTPDDFAALADLAREEGVLFISTPLDLGSADMLEPLVDAFKIASGDNQFFPLLERVARTSKPMIVSTGLSDLDDVTRAVEFVRALRDDDGIAVLHCVSSYPVAPGEAQLRAIETLREALSCAIGFSDHTVGLEAAPLAVALGARIVEKHFTLDKQFSEFRDHRLSLEPDELAELVRRIREAEQMLGEGGKEVQPSEQPVVEALRRSIVAGRDLAAGSVLAFDDLAWTRPGGGLAPGSEDTLVGRTLRRDVSFGEQLLPEDVE